jgi:hypothetical protein
MSWVNHTQLSYSYDLNNNKLTHLTQNWSAGAWVNKDLVTMTYNSNNHVSTHFKPKMDCWRMAKQYLLLILHFNASNKPISRFV